MPEELAGTSVFDLVHPDDRARNAEAFRRMAADGVPFEMEKRYVRGDGNVVWVSASVTAVLDADGRPTARSRSSSTSATGRRTEQALRESEERLRLIVENAREYAIVTLDLKRRITGWNSGAEGLLGYVAERGRSARAPTSSSSRRTASRGVPQREATQALDRGPRRRRALAPAGRTAAASGAAA